MKIRRFKSYNKHIIQSLRDIYAAHPELLLRLETLLTEAKIRKKKRKRREALARKAKKLAESPEAPQNLLSPQTKQTTAPEPYNCFGNTYYFHVKSHSHLTRHFFESSEAKEIIRDQCIHYARVCKIGILHYTLMSNHLHLTLVIEADSYKQARKQVSKMIGCIKQQFTNRYKRWHNKELRIATDYRPPTLETGTLWNGPAKIEFIEDEVDLAACTLLIEANRLRDTCFEQILDLTAPPTIAHTENAENAESTNNTPTPCSPTTRFQPCYNKLARTAANYTFQSILWYLNGGKGHPSSALTDGTDANWAPPEEFDRLWPLPNRHLPHGYRKCWFKGMLGIIRPTAQQDRRYHVSPFIQQLGMTPTERAEKLLHMVLNLCWANGPSRYRTPQQASYAAGM